MKNNILILFVFISFILQADTIFLKNGLCYFGKIREYSDSMVHFVSLDGEQFKFKDEKVESIIFSEHQTGIFEGVYRNFKYEIQFKMPADFWFLKDGDLRDGWLLTTTKEQELKEDSTMIRVCVFDLLPEEYADPDIFPQNERLWVQTAEKYIKQSINEEAIRIRKDIYKTSQEITFFRQYTSYDKRMTLGNQLTFRQINLATYYAGRIYLILYDANELNYERDLPYFENMVTEFQFIGEFPVFDVFENLGNIYFYENRFKEAMRYFEAAVKEKVTSDILNKLGVIHARLGNYKQAKEYFERALQMVPENDKIRFNAVNTGNYHYSGFGVEKE